MKDEFDGKDVKLEQKDEDPNATKKLYKFARDNVKKLVVCDFDNSQAYGMIHTNNHTEAIPLQSYRARSWLMYEYFKDFNKVYSEDAYKNALRLLTSRAIHEDSVVAPVYNRIAMHNGIIFYDLVTKDWKGIQIDSAGWREVALDETTPIFERKQHMQAQLIPVKSDVDALAKLCDLLRIQQKDRFIFKVHLISFFISQYPMPIMVFTGEQGSIKTTITKTIKRIVDPSIMLSSAIPKGMDDLTIHMYNRYISNFDNVSGFNHEVSDMFCRVITGEGVSKRQLYTDNNETIMSYTRKIIFNGIAPSMEYPDFRERTIFYETLPISEKQRLTLEEFNQSIDDILPEVLGQVFTVLSKAIKNYDMVKQEIKFKPRMSDFSVWGECISRGLGNESMLFIDTYKERLELSNLDVVNNYPIFSLIQTFMENKTEYEKPVATFYQVLLQLAEQEGVDIKSKAIKFPKAPQRIRAQAQILRSNFRAVGIDIDIYSYDRRDGKHPRGSHVIKISRMLKGDMKIGLSGLSVCQDDFQAQNDSNIDSDTMGGESVMEGAISVKNEDSRHDDRVTDTTEMFSPTSKGLKKSDYWGTPTHLFNSICQIHNVTPQLDVCATRDNRKCDTFLSENVNGLKQDWLKDAWCNPPYSQTGEWVKKCWLEHEKHGITVTALIMMDTSTNYWRDYIKGKAEVHEITHRIKFIDPETNQPGDAARFASAVVIWRANTN